MRARAKRTYGRIIVVYAHGVRRVGCANLNVRCAKSRAARNRTVSAVDIFKRSENRLKVVGTAGQHLCKVARNDAVDASPIDALFVEDGF